LGRSEDKIHGLDGTAVELVEVEAGDVVEGVGVYGVIFD
jgi:hypothetical protein